MYKLTYICTWRTSKSPVHEINLSFGSLNNTYSGRPKRKYPVVMVYYQKYPHHQSNCQLSCMCQIHYTLSFNQEFIHFIWHRFHSICHHCCTSCTTLGLLLLRGTNFSGFKKQQIQRVLILFYSFENVAMNLILVSTIFFAKNGLLAKLNTCKQQWP